MSGWVGGFTFKSLLGRLPLKTETLVIAIKTLLFICSAADLANEHSAGYICPSLHQHCQGGSEVKWLNAACVGGCAGICQLVGEGK